MVDFSLIDRIFDELAESVAAKVAERLGKCGSGVRQRLLTVEQAAEYLGRSKDAIQHMIAHGKLHASRVDRRVYLDIQDLDLLIEQSKDQCGG